MLAPTLALAAAILALVAVLRPALLRPRPRWTKPELERLIESTVRRLGTSPSLLDEATHRLERRADELRAELDAHSRKLRRSLAPPDDSHRAGESEHRRLVDGLEAMSELGRWIELLWPVLREASGAELDAVASALPEPAAEEWRRARETLEDFAARDAAAAREVLERLSAGNGEPVDVASARFLEGSGLLEGDLALPERLKRHLEPFDRPGCLGRVTLALQYLLEAYPIEQLEPARRTLLRRRMAEAAGSLRLPEDFHGLVARIAAGIGLDYRAVAYYKSRLDQRRYAFVRGQVSPISLTERVGFAAATDPAVVVRLERPFFYQSANQVYYAGHAHVSRG